MAVPREDLDVVSTAPDPRHVSNVFTGRGSVSTERRGGGQASVYVAGDVGMCCKLVCRVPVLSLCRLRSMIMAGSEKESGTKRATYEKSGKQESTKGCRQTTSREQQKRQKVLHKNTQGKCSVGIRQPQMVSSDWCCSRSCSSG